MINCLEPNEFAQFKEQWDKYLEEDLPGLDERMKGPMLILNAIPGVVTRFCCSGHTFEERLSSHPTKAYSRVQKRNFIFVVEEGHADIFFAFEILFKLLNKDEFSFCRPSLETTLLKKNFGESETYPVWVFEMNWVYELTEEEKIKGRDKTQNELWEKLLRGLFLITDPKERHKHRDILSKPYFDQPGLIRKTHNV